MDITMDDLVKFLALSELFKDIPQTELADFARIIKKETFAMSKKVFSEDDVGDNLFILYEGSIEIVIRVTWKMEEEEILQIIQPGKIFGEFSFIDGYRRSASAKALENSKALILPRSEFDKYSQEKPLVALGIMHNYAWILTNKVRKTTILLRSER